MFLPVLVLASSFMASGLPQASSQSPAPSAHATVSVAGVREAAWSPDGKRLVATYYDALWTMAPDGKDPKRLISKPGAWIVERDGAWAPDGKSIAFAADSNGQFDLWIAPASGGGAPKKLTSMPGDERWPSWTRDGQIVFSHRAPKGVWQLFVTKADGAAEPTKITPDDTAEWQGAVSPDGKLVAFISDRQPEGNDTSDVWVRGLAATDNAAAVRLTNAPGIESHPAWAPDNARVAYYATRQGQGSGVWVSTIPAPGTAAPAAGAAGGGRAGRGAAGRAGGAAPVAAPGAAAPFGLAGSSGLSGLSGLVLASRHGGFPAWSPDGEWLSIATFTTTNAGYNGNPNRNDDDVPMVMADAKAFQLWRVAAPRAVDANATEVSLPAPDAARWTSGFDQVWQTVKSLYYTTGPSAAAWDALRDKYRPQAAGVADLNGLEDVLDAMLSEQPLMKPAVESSKGVATSGSPLASQAGADILAKGGNVVDAGIAVALALGVVEPDATSLGGDGQAILFLKGMSEPIVVEYKDMSPSHATADNTKLFTPTGGRTANDGPTVANIPGVAAGLDLLYQKYGSKKVAWADLVAPAIKLADEGFILDEALPTSIAEGRAQFAKYPESAKLFLPGGRIPRPGERFVNKDYAETLRLLAKEGGRSFYTGTIAQKIVADMAASGGAITAEDLAQYRAMERKPLGGQYHGHRVYSVPAPVSSGAQMVETLNILDNYKAKPGATITTDADYFHYVIDAWRVRDGGGGIADPERWTVDYGNHLDINHALERFKLIDPAKAYAAQGGRGRGGTASPESPKSPESPAGAEFQTEDETGRVQTGTTAFVVADAEGNMIAFTQTLSTWGGNYYVSKGLGFLYNDHFRGPLGRGGGFGALLPLMRSNSTSVPTLVFAPAPAGQSGSGSGVPGYVPLMAVGCAGNAWIPASVYNIILNVVDGGMSAQRAIEAPRVLIGGTGGQIEDRIPRTILADLEARGHSFTKVGRKGEVKYGYASVAVVNAAAGTVAAGAEPRRSHGAVGAGK
jgi:gamma-glutamyltranspeptidase